MTGNAREDDGDHLAHYGKKGMKWGVRRRVRNDSIRDARANQAKRSADLLIISRERITANSKEGRKFIDDKIKDKKFEIRNNPDAKLAAKLTTGERWVKSAKVAALMGLALAGVNEGSRILSEEINQTLDALPGDSHD